MKGEKFKGNIREGFFTQRVVGVWNELPDNVVNAGSLLTVKKNLDRFMDERGVEGYGPSTGQWDEAKNGSAQTRRAKRPVSEL